MLNLPISASSLVTGLALWKISFLTSSSKSSSSPLKTCALMKPFSFNEFNELSTIELIGNDESRVWTSLRVIKNSLPLRSPRHKSLSSYLKPPILKPLSVLFKELTLSTLILEIHTL
ncbi:hypothetical protein WICMUC_001404 [Wickerhamomyces mucosus]|uniref:Uncharacterized protein n=1 Tax=Wickerhamomyces mucosus TaxID=1378264 RepID=A0A9P8PVK0_9ASCO|nr:hypothetical protein WICMUC_001404 [Wickerhamomyces mucosus]